MIKLDFDIDNFFVVRTIDLYSQDICVIGKNMYRGKIKNYSLQLLHNDIEIIGVDEI